MLALFLVLAGGTLAGVGLRAALTRPRPQSLYGMVAAPIGLLLLLLGLARWLEPSFFGAP